jgi:phospholipid/cholesterol/gamma-HCH transport system ATP-binding protein
VFDQEIAKQNEEALKELRCRMGYLFQGSALYDSMSVRDNLAFPLKRVLKIKDNGEIDERCAQVLEEVGLGDTIDKMPSELSGGMRKRMALARTLIVRPEIILYDEPTTGLDSITSREISQLILKMQKQYQSTSVIVTHDIPCAKIIADRIVVMNHGKYIATGSFEELENSDDEFIRSFFN